MIRVHEITCVLPKPIVEIPSIVEASRSVQCCSTTRSTIAPAEEVSIPRAFHPRLAPPAPHYMWGILKLYSDMENTMRLEGRICERETKIALDRLMEIDKQKIEMFRQRVETMESKQSWSIFETVVQYIASSSSFMIGIALWETAPVAGAFLLAAGGLGLLNRAASDLGLWQLLASQFTASFDLQIKIASQIDTYSLYLSTALSISGSIGLYHAGALNFLTYAGRNKVLQKCLGIIGYASGFIQVITRLELAKMDWTLQTIGAEIKERDTHSFSARQEIQANTANLRRIIELSEKIGESIKQAIASSPI